MGSHPPVLEKSIARALIGTGAHVEAARAVAGLNWILAGARPDGFPHSIFQLLNHVTYWNGWAVKWLDGKAPPTPKHAAGSWPGSPSPANAEEWDDAVRRFQSALDDLTQRAQRDLLAKRGAKTRLEMLQTIASHTSYHLGQVVLMRQRLAAWPPPGGGFTW